jgi:arylsulfatase A
MVNEAERGIHAASTHEHESGYKMNSNVPHQLTLKRPKGHAPFARASRIRWFGRLPFLAALLFAVLNPVPAHAAARPNIVIIFADDLGYGDLSCYGHPSIYTPHLDRMAAEGMRFTDFYAAAPVCTPSRAGLLTGRLPIRNGMAGTPERSVALTYSTGGLPTNEITIAGALKMKGYATACIGKWHLGHLPEFLPTRHGFDYFFGVRFANNMEPNYTVRRPKSPLSNLNPQREWWRMALLRNEETIEEDTDPHLLTPRYTEEAITFIKSNKRKPFFLLLSHTYPHAPLFASKNFRGRSAGGLYGDVVEELDWSVGEVLKTLRKEGHAENTLVFFTSDNGPALSLNLAGGSSGLLRDGKGTPWEGGMRVPAIAWWPGKIKAGVVNRELASAMDLFNTSLNLAGVGVPSDRIIDGVDMTPMLLGKGASKRDVMFYYQFDRLCAVRKGPFKAHVATYLAAFPKPLLFQLAHDPSEKFDAAAEHPKVLADLLREVEKHREKLVPGEPQF